MKPKTMTTRPVCNSFQITGYSRLGENFSFPLLIGGGGGRGEGGGEGGSKRGLMKDKVQGMAEKCGKLSFFRYAPGEE